MPVRKNPDASASPNHVNHDERLKRVHEDLKEDYKEKVDFFKDDVFRESVNALLADISHKEEWSKMSKDERLYYINESITFLIKEIKLRYPEKKEFLFVWSAELFDIFKGAANEPNPGHTDIKHFFPEEYHYSLIETEKEEEESFENEITEEYDEDEDTEVTQGLVESISKSETLADVTNANKSESGAVIATGTVATGLGLGVREMLKNGADQVEDAVGEIIEDIKDELGDGKKDRGDGTYSDKETWMEKIKKNRKKTVGLAFLSIPIGVKIFTKEFLKSFFNQKPNKESFWSKIKKGWKDEVDYFWDK